MVGNAESEQYAGGQLFRPLMVPACLPRSESLDDEVSSPDPLDVEGWRTSVDRNDERVALGGVVADTECVARTGEVEADGGERGGRVVLSSVKEGGGRGGDRVRIGGDDGSDGEAGEESREEREDSRKEHAGRLSDSGGWGREGGRARLFEEGTERRVALRACGASGGGGESVGLVDGGGEGGSKGEEGGVKERRGGSSGEGSRECRLGFGETTKEGPDEDEGGRRRERGGGEEEVRRPVATKMRVVPSLP